MMGERSPGQPKELTIEQLIGELHIAALSHAPGDYGITKMMRACVQGAVEKIGPDILFVDYVMGGRKVRGVIVDQDRQTGEQNWVLTDKYQLRFWENRDSKPRKARQHDWLILAPKIPEAFERRLWIHQRRTENQPQAQS